MKLIKLLRLNLRNQTKPLHYFAVCVLALFASQLPLGCKGEPDCKIEFESFPEENKPLISIESVNSSECDYNIEIGYCPSSFLYFDSKGRLRKDRNGIWVSVREPSSLEFCFFKSNAKLGSLDSFKIEYLKNDFDLEVVTKKTKLERIIPMEGDEVFVFRVFQFFCYESDSLDVVYFLSFKKGILGSYVSYIDGSTEYYMIPKGNLFTNHIDYSKMKKGMLR
ncbi:MAG TPA: hypothetical protein PLM56_12170 [Cyclobacteriaceae bacterium]|jgi:hypothetical protein|nr:hypothetical protein [Cyclobacteriaceae bacterium]HRF34249.1 hypothetical protein [Cyclobacteriaceae bacterium]